ncbi:hypothetical protein Bca52824_027534 [Brassica carinata]|uniref:DUF4283 domain-containing protein n=1 Tax=Brassica carinata TaxID=52824 RepID=A0A8X7VAN3_BRACI|nr:hypothetical protein Bca52824_027534 [Brassica carinata]
MSQIGGNYVKPLRRIQVPHFDNSDLIRSLNKTLIGRITNPETQNVESLVSVMPKIWKLDDGRVTGSDLGLGSFRFDFKREEDILEVLQTGPFSFNQWMVSIVRWKPGVHKNYTSDITFWVRLVGVPTHLWEDRVLRRIGDELVTVDGTKPLCFEISVRFETSGEEVDVKVEYEKLFGYCATCFRLSHDKESCPESDLRQEAEEEKDLKMHATICMHD